MRIKELIFDTKEPTVYCESFVYEPSNVEEEKMGHLFMIGRIRNVPESSFYLINLLASRIKREYYSVYNRTSATAIEAALKEGNKILKENEERINWLGNLDFLVATVGEKKIYFTLLGRMRAFILRGEEFIDIVKNLILEKDVLFPFSTILQGSLRKDDVLIFSTSNIFSKEKLLKFGKELFPIEEKRISKIIESDESGTALVIELEKEARAIERIAKEGKRKSFVEKLPHFTLPQINFPKFGENFKLTATVDKEKIKEKMSAVRSRAGSVSRNLKGIINNLNSKISSFFSGEKRVLKDKNKMSLPKFPIEKFSPSSKSKLYFWGFKKERDRTKIIIGGIIFLAIILTGLWFYQHRENLEISAIESIIKAAEEKKLSGDSSLIYNDKAQAISYFTEGLDLLNSIENPGPKKGEVNSLKKEIEDEINKLLNRRVLTGLKPLFEIKEGLEKFSPQNIIVVNNFIYLFSSDSSLVYQWDTDKGQGVFLEQREKVLGGTVLNKKPFFLLEPSAVVITDTEKILPFDTPYDDFSISEVDDFLNNFYIFDEEKGEIAKYSVSGDKISSPDLWFEKREAGKGAISFSIDGSIYLLLPDGGVKRFSAGALRDDFPAVESYPAIKNSTDIFTSANNKYIYISEPSQKRFFVLDKEGKLVIEYQSGDLKEIKDIWVNAGDKTMYVLSEMKVFEIKL
ncbi:MAG: hypothetical protein V1841_01320 [Patescibacteria group bacterium]